MTIPDHNISENGLQRNGESVWAGKHRQQRWSGAAPIVAVFFVVMTALTYTSLRTTPQPLGLDAPAEQFSEARALGHVDRLTPGGQGRLVSHPSIAVAIQYLLTAAQQVAKAAASRSDISVQVEQQMVDGALHMLFLDNVIGNAYQNLTNIVLTITPHELGTSKGVLVGSHFDSVIGSPGASDCASQVGVMLETARVLVADSSIKLLAPIVFVFNGGEETFSQAAHGFVQAYDRPLGAFINMESTGSAGPDYLFQQTGGWPAAAYARSAKRPCGAVVGQDIFESGLLPADSDYRMFSYKHFGSLPGLDIAFLLDGTAYHTDRDTLERIRHGTLQTMGENVVGAIPEFARTLARHEATGMDELEDKVVFFDVFSRYMVVYKLKTAKMLHNIPVALALAMPLLSNGRARGSQVPTYGAILRGAAAYTVSFLSAILAPALVGLARVLLLGKPMLWYAQHWLAFAMYVPISAAALLVTQSWAMQRLHLDLSNALLGMALALGSLASLMTSLQLGSAFLFALLAAAALLGMPSAGQECRPRSLLTALAAAAAPTALSLPVAFLLANVLMDKTSMMGVLPPPLGPAVPDAIIGFVIGLAVALALGTMGPWLAALLPPRRLKALCALAVLCALGVAGWAAATRSSYSVDAPKRILLQHIFQQGEGGGLAGDKLVIGGSDVVSIQSVLDLNNHTILPTTHRDWHTLYPLSARLGGVAVAAPPGSQPPFQTLPSIRRVSSQPGEDGRQRHSMELHTGAPCWGVLNVTGPLAAWSFADGLPSSDFSKAGKPEHAVRIAGNGGSELWRFWLETTDDSALRIELTVSFWERSTSALDKLIAEMPPWTTMLSGVTVQSEWEFPND